MCVKTAGIGQYQIGKNDDILTINGLGSCLGIVIYDDINKVAGVLHAFLPSYKNGTDNKIKYVDTGIEIMINELIKNGAAQKNLKAKIAGGATLFNTPFKIGEDNYNSCINVLKEKNIRIISEDCGGTHGRTIVFCPNEDKLTIKSIKGKNNVICECI